MMRSRMLLTNAVPMLCLALASVAAAAASPAAATAPQEDTRAYEAALVNRITWGATPAELARIREIGAQRYLHAQLHPDAHARLPAEVQSAIDALPINQETEQDAQARQRKLRQDARDLDPQAKLQAQREARAISRQRAQDAASRAVWRALYSPAPLQEQMTWFWMNHFNVFAGKGDVGTYLPQYEERAIRPHALGKFRDMLRATVRSPAMLVYLDNTRNVAGHINENYAREIMELHTLGVGGGYTQKDVQELARILTGLGVHNSDKPPKVKPELRAGLVQQGLFLFNPARHDSGDKVFLGHTIRGGGLEEVDQAIDLLARHPSTARFVSTKLAAYFVGESPPPALVARMAKTFLAQDGDIAATLQTMIASPEFVKSLKTGVFKDPVHYVFSALRLTYADMPPIRNPKAVLSMLQQMGQGMYQRPTPDGYPMSQSDWAGSGQMTQRFEIARAIAAAPQPFYRTTEAPEPVALPKATPLLDANPDLLRVLSPATRQAVGQARKPVDANTYLLASPEFMRR